MRRLLLAAILNGVASWAALADTLPTRPHPTHNACSIDAIPLSFVHLVTRASFQRDTLLTPDALKPHLEACTARTPGTEPDSAPELGPTALYLSGWIDILSDPAHETQRLNALFDTLRARAQKAPSDALQILSADLLLFVSAAGHPNLFNTARDYLAELKTPHAPAALALRAAIALQNQIGGSQEQITADNLFARSYDPFHRSILAFEAQAYSACELLSAAVLLAPPPWHDDFQPREHARMREALNTHPDLHSACVEPVLIFCQYIERTGDTAPCNSARATQGANHDGFASIILNQNPPEQ